MLGFGRKNFKRDHGVLDLGSVSLSTPTLSQTAMDNHFGYVDFNDASTTNTPVTLTPNTWTTLPNDGLGSFSQNQLPNGDDISLDPSGGVILSNMPLHSELKIRMDYTVYPNVNNAFLEFGYLLGSGSSNYRLSRTIGNLPNGAGTPYQQGVTFDFIYVGDTNTQSGFVTPQVKLSTGGSVVNAGMAISIYKRA